MWEALGSLVAGLLGLPSLIAKWLGIRQGRAQQKAADDAATVQEARHGQQVDATVARLSDAQLDDELRRFSRE